MTWKKSKTIHVEQIQLELSTPKLNYNAYDGTVDIDRNRANVPLIEMVTNRISHSCLSSVLFVKNTFLSWLIWVFALVIWRMGHWDAMSMSVLQEEIGWKLKLGEYLGNHSRCKVWVRETSSAIEARQDPLLNKKLEAGMVRKQFVLAQKKDAIDYRYFPDVELPRIRLHPSIGKDLSQTLPELPEQLIQQLCEGALPLRSEAR